MIGRRGRSRATTEAVRPCRSARGSPWPERLGEVAGRVRHRLADRRLVARLRQLVPVAEARLDGARDPVHVGDRLDRDTRRPRSRRRASAPRCRRGSRWRRRSPRRASARPGATIDSSICVAVITGLPRSSAASDDPLLEERHERGADLDAEVAARDHDRVGLLEDLVERVDGLRLLDLRDHVRRASRPARSARAGRGRRRRSARTRARRSRRPARARTRGRRCPCASATGSGSGRPAGSRPCAT